MSVEIFACRLSCVLDGDKEPVRSYWTKEFDCLTVDQKLMFLVKMINGLQVEHDAMLRGVSVSQIIRGSRDLTEQEKKQMLRTLRDE